MAFNENLTQALSYIDVINFNAANNTNLNSIGVDMSKFKRILYVVQNGGIGAAGTIDGRLQCSANSNFNTITNISGTNLTQITANNVAETVEVRADQVTNANANARYVRLQLTTGGNALTGVWATGIGSQSEQAPASQYNLNTTYLAVGVVCNI